MIKRTQQILPAGKYLVGDLCYFLGHIANDDHWMEHINVVFDESYDANPGSESATTHLEWYGHLVATASTMYGDGLYRDLQGRTYPVDAGCIGCAPYEMLSPAVLKNIKNNVFNGDAAYVVDFPNDFHVTYNDGIIRFGDEIEIQTGDDEEDDWDDWEEEEDY